MTTRSIPHYKPPRQVKLTLQEASKQLRQAYSTGLDNADDLINDEFIELLDGDGNPMSPDGVTGFAKWRSTTKGTMVLWKFEPRFMRSHQRKYWKKHEQEKELALRR